jgi:spermidine synthase
MIYFIEVVCSCSIIVTDCSGNRLHSHKIWFVSLIFSTDVMFASRVCCFFVVWSVCLASSLSNKAVHPLRQEEDLSVERYIGEFFDEETGLYQAIRIHGSKPLVREQSKYQLIEVHYNPHFGKILVLDGVLQLTERDASAYNEMMAHLPLMQHPHPQRVLVIGGGDGYVIQEVLKHESVLHVDHVDLDADVINVCKTHFDWGFVWDDPRVHLHVRDGAAFLDEVANETYDVIIQDSSDPWAYDINGARVDLPSSVLYSEKHFANLHRVLKPNGVLNIQAETLQIPSDLEGIVQWRDLALGVGFKGARYASIMISTVSQLAGWDTVFLSWEMRMQSSLFAIWCLIMSLLRLLL